MILKIIITLILSLIGAILGRLGGKEGWDTKYRDLGVSLCICLILALVGQIRGIFQWVALVLCFGAQFGALTTYRYFLPKPKDYQWYHYALHGFMVSFAAIFWAWVTGRWIGYVTRCIINTIGLGLVSYFISDDEKEEKARYFIVTVTTPLLLW